MPIPSYVEVAFSLPLNRTFHYQLPSGFSVNGHRVGGRVLAPFGKKRLIGYVVDTTDEKPPFATKPIAAWLDENPFIDSTLVALARWVSETYLCSLGEALACMAPPSLRPPKRQPNRPSPPPSPADDAGEGEEKERGAAELLNKLPRPPQAGEGGGEGRLEIKLSSDQKNALDKLLSAVESKQFQPFLLRGITDSGKTELYLRTIDRVLEKGKQALFLLPEIALTPPFIERLQSRYSSERVGVWHSGIKESQRYATWSGVRDGALQILLGARSAVFAPFARLGVIVFDEEHEPSYKQEDRPRYHAREVALKRAEQTNSVLIMGSATPSLESYWKAKQGTYTLLELTSRVEQRQLPTVTLIDRRPNRPSPPPSPAHGAGEGEEKGAAKFLNKLPRPPQAGEGGGEGRRFSKGRSTFAVFSEPLKLAIEQRLARREQVMLFINRRGFTPFIRCSTCGWVARCSRCSLAMTVHHDTAGAAPYLQCHACVRREAVPIQCPSCKGMRLRQFGIGTQRVEEEVKHLFPFVKIARLDQDAARYRRTYEKIYKAFAGGELDVLVGTQMIAKGFHFPNVTLVGIVDADVSLHLPDFRSAERTFQLITQVAGRTGRGQTPGKVLVQTHHPDHYALQAAQAHDYLKFFDEEMKYRQELNYPPYVRLVNILIRGRKENVVQNSADDLLKRLVPLGPDVEILGPSPAAYSRLRGQFRYEILLKGQDKSLAPFLEFLHHHRLPKAFMSVDVDPVDLL